MGKSASQKKPAGNGYQVSFLNQLRDDAPLDPNAVLIGDRRWADCLREFRRARWFGLDTEFYEAGKGPWKTKAEIDYWRTAVRLIQVGLPSGRVMIADLGGLLDDRDRLRELHAEFFSVLKERGESWDVPVYGMALLTEYLLLRIHYGIALRKLRDVMLASQVVWAGVAAKGKRWTRQGLVMEQRLSHKLSAICDRLGVAIDKSEQVSDWAGRLSNTQLNYAARDPVAPVECWRALKGIVAADGLEFSVVAECDAQAAFGECEFNGLPVDEPMLRRNVEKWEEVREAFWSVFRKRFPDVSPTEPIAVAHALTEALDVRTCGTCGHQHDPLARREPPGWKPDDALSALSPPPKGWRLAAPPGRCPKCGGPPEGFAQTFLRKFWEEKQDKQGRDFVSTHTDASTLADLQDVTIVRALLEGRACSACLVFPSGVLENLADDGRIRVDFQQIVGGFQEHGKDGDAGKGMGRSSASKPVNTQNPSNLQPAHEKLGAPSVREPVRAPDADLPRRLREAAGELERGSFYRGAHRRPNGVPLPQDAAGAQRMRRTAAALERRGIGAGGRSRAFGVADLSQAHARIAAEASQDPVMLRDFRAGIDFHLAMAHRIGKKAHPDLTFEEAVRAYGDPKHPLHKSVKAWRKTAKNLNYGGLNLQSGKTLKKTVEKSPEPIYGPDGEFIPLEEWEEMRKEWVSLYSGLTAFQRARIRKANSHRHRFDHVGVDGEYGESRALTGRRLFLVKDWSPYSESYSVKGTDCVSAVWMMTEADCVKFAMGNILRDFDARPEWGALLVNMAHDEIDFECWAEHAEAVAAAVHSRFQEAMVRVGVVSVPVDEPGADSRKLIKESWASK